MNSLHKTYPNKSTSCVKIKAVNSLLQASFTIYIRVNQESIELAHLLLCHNNKARVTDIMIIMAAKKKEEKKIVTTS